MPLISQRSALRHLQYTLIALLFIALVGVVGFRIIEGWGWFDSIYMVVITMATVGYKEVH